MEVLPASKPDKLIVAVEPEQTVGCDAPVKVGVGFDATIIEASAGDPQSAVTLA